VDLFVVNSTAVKESTLIEAKVYPNPVKNKITIESDALSGTYQLIIYDLSGREVLKQEFQVHSNRISVDIALNSGSYILTLLDKKQIIINQSLIVQ
jgi:hypothetical protein